MLRLETFSFAEPISWSPPHLHLTSPPVSTKSTFSYFTLCRLCSHTCHVGGQKVNLWVLSETFTSITPSARLITGWEACLAPEQREEAWPERGENIWNISVVRYKPYSKKLSQRNKQLSLQSSSAWDEIAKERKIHMKHFYLNTNFIEWQNCSFSIRHKNKLNKSRLFPRNVLHVNFEWGKISSFWVFNDNVFH